MRNVTAGIIGVAVALFALVVLQALLPGVLVGSLVVVAERIHAKGAVAGRFGGVGAVVAVVFVPLLVAYALLITQQFVIGALAVAAFLAAVWLSGSGSSGLGEPVGDSGGLAGD